MNKLYILTSILFLTFSVQVFGQVNPFSLTANDSTICDGQTVNLSVQSTTGNISTLTCASAINTGNLIVGIAASSVSSSIPYTGGNGGSYNGQTITSTGVSGLTATLSSGVFNNGSGSLVYTITGTTSTIGTASFSLTIGGQSCNLNLAVTAGQPTYPSGSVFCNGATFVNDVTNPITGKIWMDRNLGASQVATSSTDANSYGDLYQWGRRSDGHQCRTSATTSTLSSVDAPSNGNFITINSGNNDWRSPQNVSFWQGVNGVNNPCPSGYRIPTDTEINAERLNWSSTNSSGAYASPLKLPLAGIRSRTDGSLNFVGTDGNYWSRTVASTNTYYLRFSSSNAFTLFSSRAGGLSVRCIKETIGTIGALNCGTADINGSFSSGVTAYNVSMSITYTGGNGGFYGTQSFSSTGVTGLTASITQNLFSNSSGTLIFSITGTPSSNGIASFLLIIGGRTCTLNVTVYGNQPNYPTGSVFCNVTPTIVNDVTNPVTGKTWMDRNLGASRVATSLTDVYGLGDFYQWGRRSDGHQCRTSSNISTLSSIDIPANGNFIIGLFAPSDWRSPQNANLWQGSFGTNNPCPTGYHLPTETEINSERLSWSSNNSAGAFATPLKLTLAGYRLSTDGLLYNAGNSGYYWSSTVSSTYSRNLYFTSSTSSVNPNQRAFGFTVRCIKEYGGSIGSIDCGSSTVTGNLSIGVIASNVNISVPYSGGNGGIYLAQSVTSTGITGLTAVLSAGNFANETGNLVYAITGTPSTSGMASFALSVGGQNCILNVIVYGVQPTYPVASVFCNGITTIVNDVTNPTTGKTWMDRNIGASQVATSSTDPNAYGVLYQWGRRSDGHQCRTSTNTSTLSSIDVPANGRFIMVNTTPYDWRSQQSNNLWQGINGVNNPCPTGYRLPTDTELNAERLSWTVNTSVGALASPLKLSMTGYRNNSDGSLNFVGFNGYFWSSTVSGIYSRYLTFTSSSSSLTVGNRSNGNAVRCIKEYGGSIDAINCGSSTLTGNLISETATSGVSVSVPYTGGNGGFYTSQIVTSTGVTGLTATLSAGNYVNGSGNLVYTVTGTPSTEGIASFTFNIGEQSCILNATVSTLQGMYPSGSVFCASGPTVISDVTNPTTGKIWMNRNLGALQVATSSTDANSYGDLYQWGRRSDGHQCRTSSTTSAISSIDLPENGNFILAPTNPLDWRSPQNSNLWQGVNGVNNPCPSGYRLPTETEFEAERLSWSQNNSIGAFASPLKLPKAGQRGPADGSFLSIGSRGSYWSSTVSSNISRILYVDSNANIVNASRAYGFSVRCIKN